MGGSSQSVAAVRVAFVHKTGMNVDREASMREAHSSAENSFQEGGSPEALYSARWKRQRLSRKRLEHCR